MMIIIHPVIELGCTLLQLYYTVYIHGSFYLLGTVTTSSTLYAFLNILLHYPDVQRKLQAEVDVVTEDVSTMTFLTRYEMP